MPRIPLSSPKVPGGRQCPGPLGHFQVAWEHYQGNWTANACWSPFTLRGLAQSLALFRVFQIEVAPAGGRQVEGGSVVALTCTRLAVMSSGLALQCSRSRATPSIRDWYSLASSSRVSSLSCSTTSCPPRTEERSPASRRPLARSLSRGSI